MEMTEGMTFGQALAHMKIGAKVARPQWDERQSMHIKPEYKKVWMTYKDGTTVAHIVNSVDLLAEDWKVVEGN